MAIPRIFVSSTCYDLKEVRFQLRHFISEFGFDPVMSEFGDIFFDLKLHVQEACKNEIEKTDLFILIIGNSYGSIYHKHQDHIDPDSVTLQEFRKCLEVGIPKYIFINKFLKHDFDNYRRTKAQAYAKNFQQSKKEIDEADFTEEYNKTYPFPQESYKYIFKFLEITENLNKNNAIYTFESFDEIKSSLKKQWAALFYEALKQVQTLSQFSLSDIEKKLSKIESHIELIAKNPDKKQPNDKANPTLSEEISKEQKINLQEKISHLLDIFFKDGKNNRIRAIQKKATENDAESIFNRVEDLLKKYKLSKTIPINEILEPLPEFSYYTTNAEIPYSSLQGLVTIKNILPPDDISAFYAEFLKRINSYPEMDNEIPF